MITEACQPRSRACIVAWSAENPVRRGEIVETQDMFVGYGPAAEYLGIKRNTLSSYVARGIGPVPLPDRHADGQYNLPVFTKRELDRWKADRPGQGARTDLAGVST